MELLAYLIYFLANRGGFLLVFSIFFTIAGVSLVSYWSREFLRRHSDGSSTIRLAIMASAVVGYAFIVGLLVFSVVNVVRPHIVDGYLINLFGVRTDAVVTSVEPTWYRLNRNTVHKHNIVFKTASGDNIETYFHTWDFNVYPPANSVVYPQRGETFRILYLPSFPTTFLILTEPEDSPKNHAFACAELTKALEAAKIKHDFDPKDPKFKAALDEAAKKVIDAKCGTATVDGNSF